MKRKAKPSSKGFKGMKKIALVIIVVLVGTVAYIMHAHLSATPSAAQIPPNIMAMYQAATKERKGADLVTVDFCRKGSSSGYFAAGFLDAGHMYFDANGKELARSSPSKEAPSLFTGYECKQLLSNSSW